MDKNLIQLPVELNRFGESPLWQIFGCIVIQKELRHFFSIDFSSVEEIPLQLIINVPYSSTQVESNAQSWILEEDQGVIYIKKENLYVHINGAFITQKAAQARLEEIKKIMPKEKDGGSNSVRIQFWCYMGGATFFNRSIEAPKWGSIEDNYESSVRKELSTLMAINDPEKINGRLLLWKGDPGTGKTYALRALCKEWKKWCSAHYIIDVDTFFSSASYMMDMIMRTSTMSESEDVYDHPLQPVLGVELKQWNLLILEDAGELITCDAKEKTGQALAKLLNLSDGLLGQGIKLLILITTNEENEKLNTAVGRSGRCFSNISFNPLSFEEARKWLETKGMPLSDISSFLKINGDEARILANLYAFCNNQKIVGNDGAVKRSVGFLK